MRVKVLYFGALKALFGRTESELEISDGMTSGDLLPEIFRGREKDLEKWRGKILLAVNLNHAKRPVALREGDEVALMPPLAGG